MSLANMQEKLSRVEMKQILAGSGLGGHPAPNYAVSCCSGGLMFFHSQPSQVSSCCWVGNGGNISCC